MLTSIVLPTETKYEKADAFIVGPIQDAGAQRSRLRDESQHFLSAVPKPQSWRSELCPGTMMPRQLGPKIRIPLNFFCSSRHLASSVLAFRPTSAKAGRNNHDAARARLAARTNDARHRRRRRANHRQVRRDWAAIPYSG